MNSDTNLDEDLSSFEDYLAEFESSINFDSEVCPTCGIKLSESLKTDLSTFVFYKSAESERGLEEITNKLNKINSPYKIEKKLNQDSINNIDYIYEVLIPFKYLEKFRSVTQS